MSDDPQYWIVGATLHGHSATKTFVNRGYWQLGKDSKPKRDVLYRERFAQIKPDDRLAIKSLRGKGTGMMTIRSIGIVKEIDNDERRVYVHWLFTDASREVPLHGCMDAINGPYGLDENHLEWLNQIFRI